MSEHETSDFAYDAEAAFEAPSGQYEARCTACKYRPTDKGYPRFVIEWTLEKGVGETADPPEGVTVADFITFYPKSMTKEYKRAWTAVNKLKRATGVTNLPKGFSAEEIPEWEKALEQATASIRLEPSADGQRQWVRY